MKQYRIVVKQGYSAVLEAENKKELQKKLSIGYYGVLPTRGRTMIHFTPENIKEIIELVPDNSKQNEAKTSSK